MCKISAQWSFYPLPTDFPINNTFKNLIYSSKEKVWANYTWGTDVPTYQSSDGGATFNTINNFAFDLFQPINDSIIYALTYNGKLLKSTDGFQSFDTLTIFQINGDTGFKKEEIIDFYFYGDSVGWVMGDDTTSGCKEIWTTSDGGISWDKLACDSIKLSNARFKGVYKGKKSIAQGRVYIKDGRSLYKYNRFLIVDQNGHNWRESDTLRDIKFVAESFVFIDTLTGFAARANNQDSTLAITLDGGKSWVLSQNLPIIAVTLCYARPVGNKPGFLIASGLQGSYISYDSARSWLYVDDVKHSNMSFFDAETGVSMIQPTFNQNGYMLVFNGKIPLPVGVATPPTEKARRLTVFPNPTSTSLQISLENNVTVNRVTINNIEGKTVYDQAYSTADPFKNIISVNSFRSGLYIINITTNDERKVWGKFIVEN